MIADTIAARPPLRVNEKDARLSIAVPEGDDKYAASIYSDEEFPSPTEEESQTLRKVAATLPLVTFSLCFVEFAERASYYGAQTVFNNFIEFPLPAGMCCRNDAICPSY